MKKVTGATTTRYIFSGVKVIAEYVNGAAVGSPTREYIYSGSALLSTIEGSTTTYHHQDHLSVRINTDSSGTVVGQQGNFPFGEAWYTTSTTTKWRFTSYERDAESGNDYAIFRHYSNRLGRFLTSDALAGTVFDPQSLNRYAYVEDDPVEWVDPLGLTHEEGHNPPLPHPDCKQVCWWDNGKFAGCTTICGSGDVIPFPSLGELQPLEIFRPGGTPIPDLGQIPGFPISFPPLPAPLHCNPKFIEQASQAWQRAANGIAMTEAGFLVQGSTAVPSFERLSNTNEVDKITFRGIRENTVANFHTHRNGRDARPLGADQNLRRPVSGSLVPVYVGSNRGLYMTDPKAQGGYRKLRDGLDWLKPCK